MAPASTQPRPEVVTRGPASRQSPWIEATTSADHKSVAKLYLGTALTFLAVAVVQLVLLRFHLLVPDSTILSPEIFNRILTAQNLTFVVLFAVPLVLGLMSYLVPLQIGARGVALPRIHQLSFWLYGIGTFIVYASFLYTVPEIALSPLPPLADEAFSPSNGVDAWIGGVFLVAAGFTLWAVNMAATLRTQRAPGMAWRRAPIFTWSAATVSYLLLLTGPVMLAGLTMLTVDRHFGGVFFDAAEGGQPLMFTHLSWIFFTGCQAIALVAAAGVISEILPAFARKPLFSHRAAALSIVAIGVLGVLAWMQNMYSAPIAKGFAYFAMLAAVALLVPVGTLFFTWMATLAGGALRMTAAVSFALGAAVLMVFGLAGQLATSVIPVGLQLENTTAAHQDTALTFAGASVLAGFAALHYWLPKISGRVAPEGPAKAALGAILAGATLYGTGLFLAGLEGQPVDVYRYFEGTGLTAYNVIASIGAGLAAAGILLELASLAVAYGSGREAGHDPWRGSTLEWFALSPPPPHNFDAVPDVRSAEPLHDIREAIREREGAFVAPSPLAAATPSPVIVEEPEAADSEATEGSDPEGPSREIPSEGITGSDPGSAGPDPAGAGSDPMPEETPEAPIDEGSDPNDGDTEPPVA